MDFFDHQDIARRKTGRLVALFVLAVVAIVVLVYVAIVVILGLRHEEGPLRLWDGGLFAMIAAGVLVVVTVASLIKIKELSAGGHFVAASLGGTHISGANATGHERKLLNIVEEMAIAAGTPVPDVFILEEDGINAFAAGFSADDAVIGVTRGAIGTLSRDQLQGVIAHEFSHILNGDMRLNIRLIGVIAGIVVLSVIGYHILRVGAYSGAGRSRRGKSDGGGAIVMLGVAMIVIGGVGAFFANLIKAAVSRQREFLADASAVQFTRNPEGIAGALKKIGGWTHGTQLQHPQAAEVSHMLFGDGVKRFAGGMFATHPPLAQRIGRIDPSFDGAFGTTRKLKVAGTDAASGFAGGEASVQTDAISQIGQPTGAHVSYATQLLAGLPNKVREMAREPWGARALIYALLLDDDPKVSNKQIKRLAEHADEGVRRATLFMKPILKQTDETARLPLVDLATPALRALSPQQYQAFKENVEHLAAADDRISLFEWTLQRILLMRLEPHFTGKKPDGIKHRSLGPVADHCAMLLSTLAHVGQGDAAAAERAFDAGGGVLGLENLAIASAKQCGLRTVSAALDELATVTPQHKRTLIKACAATISADRQVTVREAELFRAVCDSLGVPAPPLLPGQTLAS